LGNDELKGTGGQETGGSFEEKDSLMRFEDLDVWKRAARLSANIYRALSSLKDYGFKDQITRSGLSISCNIQKVWKENQLKNV